MQENGIDLLAVRAVDPAKYALQLMDILFTVKEMASSVYIASKRTSKPGSRCKKSGIVTFIFAHIINFYFFLLLDCVKKIFTEQHSGRKWRLSEGNVSRNA